MPRYMYIWYIVCMYYEMLPRTLGEPANHLCMNRVWQAWLCSTTWIMLDLVKRHKAAAATVSRLLSSRGLET